MAVTKKKAAPQASSVVYTEPWGVFTRGAPVRVLAERTARLRGHSYTFLHYAQHEGNGKEWVDVLDRSRSGEKISSFKPHEIELIVVKPKRKYTKRAK